VGGGKTFFHEKKGFSPPHTPPLFEKSEVCFAHVVRKTGNINLSCPYSRKRALHVCQRQTLHIAKQYFTQDLSCASRWFAAQTNTSPPLFEKSEVCFAHVVRKTGNIKLSYHYSRSERFTFAAGKHFTLRSNASRRIYPALHVGLLRKPTQKRGMLPLRCRGKIINLSCPYSRKRALHVCQRQTLHIAKQCFMQDLSCASRWFAAQTNTKAGYVAAPMSRQNLKRLLQIP